MAIAPTGAIFKTLEFDGENSGNYGVYISGEAVFNAPERDVEMIIIPNRNGSFALDNGRFENIEVTYPAGIFADTETDFAEAISEFRNILCSKRGYCRLTDDYNPDEYRMAIYKSGLEVTPAQLKAGEFEITFECKPQRFLTSGETAVAVTSGDTLTNPTLFEARPMLEVKGYGDIDIGSETVTIDNVPFGVIPIFSERMSSQQKNFSITLDTYNVLQGDGFIVSFAGANMGHLIFYSIVNKTKYALRDSSQVLSYTNCSVNIGARTTTNFNFTIIPNDASFNIGTAGSQTATALVKVKVLNKSNSTISETDVTFTCSVTYDGDETITISISASPSSVTNTKINYTTRVSPIYANSTKSSLGDPMYIDLDIGEAYNLDSGMAVSVNNSVTLPAKLPTLQSGNTTITYDNTILSLDVVPRWWKI